MRQCTVALDGVAVCVVAKLAVVAGSLGGEGQGLQYLAGVDCQHLEAHRPTD